MPLSQGCTYDHVQLSFYVNGRPLECSLLGARGVLYPAFYVDEGAILEIAFSDFSNRPPEGFLPIMFEKTLI